MYWAAGAGPWLCGACGQTHGWDCPYFGYPGKRLEEWQRELARQRMAADKKAGRYPFKKQKAIAEAA